MSLLQGIPNIVTTKENLELKREIEDKELIKMM